MKLSKSMKEHFPSVSRRNIILENVKERYPFGMDDNETAMIEYGQSDAMVTVRAYKGYLIFENTIGPS